MTLKKYDRDLLAAVESTDKKLLPLFHRAVERGESDLEILLAQNAMSSDGVGPATYHCMARDQYVHGHNHLGAAKVAAGRARPQDFQYYGNALIVDEDGAGDRLSLDEALSFMFRRCNSYDRLPKLIDMVEEMDCSDWLSALGEIWATCDNISQFVADLFEKTPFAHLVENPMEWRHLMMTADERLALDALPPRVQKHNKDGLSWSLDRRIAAEFPFLSRYRSRGKPLLITATVLREQVLAFKNDREEEEVIAWGPDIQDISYLKAT